MSLRSSKPHVARTRLLHSGQTIEWRNVLEQMANPDFFHLPGYHQMAEESEKSRARLFVYEQGGCLLVLPLLFRPLENVEALAPMTAGWQDATSVYGYSGPLSSEVSTPPEVIEGFQRELFAFLRAEKVVSVFSRLNPLMDQAQLLGGLGECVESGQTVSIDLTTSEQEQLGQYRLNHRRTIGKLKRMGFTVVKDTAYLDAFADIYEQTMRRVNALGFYHYRPAYFRELLCKHPKESHLFVALYEERVIAGLLVVGTHKVAHCHLSGTLDEFLRFSPMKLLFDAARQWACAHGFESLHLGGGVGCRRDSLFHFKTGFSSLRHTFRCWRWIVCPDVYQHLCQRASLYFQNHGTTSVDPGFFPFYRAQPESSDQEAQPEVEY